jgi:hypothetical protein
MMIEWLIRRSIATGAFLLWLAFLPLLLFMPRQELFEVLNAVVFSVSIGVVVGYSNDLARVLRQPIKELDAGDALRIGVIIGWTATAIVFGILWYWRLVGKENEVIDSAVSALSRWVLITAGMLHLAASGSIDGVVPLRSYLRAGIVVAVGLFLGALIITYTGVPVQLPRAR